MKKRALIAAGLLTVLFLALAEETRAHGGRPKDIPTPLSGPPGDPTPPPIPAGMSTPRGNPRPDVTKPPGTGTPSTPTGAAGPTTRRNGGAAGEGYAQWTYWWENNKDRFLNVRRTVRSGGILSGDSGYYLGRGQRRDALLPFGPTEEQIDEEVLPALRRALADQDFDTRAAGLIGLGKAARDAAVLHDIRRGFADPNAQVRESASLALGLLGRPEAVPMLVEIMKDSPAGRRLVGRRSGVETRTRAFAAIGLGLIGDERAIDELQQLLRRADSFSRSDIPAAAVHALGLIGDSRAVPDLIAVLDNGKLDRYIRSAAPVALGKIGDRSAAPIFARVLANDRADDLVRWSAIIGYGRLLRGSEDDGAVRLLTGLLKDGNAQTRNFATMGIGYIGGDAARNTLLKAYRIARPDQRPWISLALGVYGWGKDHDETIVDQVRRRFQEERSATWKAGHAIALGLLGDRGSARLLREELAKSQDIGLRGHLCVALGLLRDVEAQEQLQRVLLTSRSFPGLQQKAAIGLGLMGDKSVVDLITGVMEEFDSAYVLGSSAIALGLIGDRTALEPLARIAGNEDAKKITRALATVGLGIVADKDPLPRLSHLAEDNNYHASVDFMAELLTIL